MEHALITGFPGFIGRRLARALLAGHPELRVTALVEERMLEVASAEAAAIGERLRVVPGDISKHHLGLSNHDHHDLSTTVDATFHLAAIYDLAVALELAQRVNVAGTGNVLDFCAGAEKLERLVYVSTAYVAGLRRGVVYEHELALGQQFKNHYESTKFQAELWVRERMAEIPSTVLRPAIVVGDSKTGETEKFDGPYYLLRMASQASGSRRPAMQLGRADAPFNVVPVDYIVAAMLAAADDDRMIGETLHLVDTEPLSAHDVFDTLNREYSGKPTRGRIPPLVAKTALRLPQVRAMFGDTPWESIAYMNHPVRFDTRRAVELLEPHGLRPPHFDSYAGPMTEFFRAHEHDPAYAPKR